MKNELNGKTLWKLELKDPKYEIWREAGAANFEHYRVTTYNPETMYLELSFKPVERFSIFDQDDILKHHVYRYKAVDQADQEYSVRITPGLRQLTIYGLDSTNSQVYQYRLAHF